MGMRMGKRRKSADVVGEGVGVEGTMLGWWMAVRQHGELCGSVSRIACLSVCNRDDRGDMLRGTGACIVQDCKCRDCAQVMA